MNNATKTHRVRAVAYQDGYAFVEYGEDVFSIQPPFTRLYRATGADVERAVADYEFEKTEQEFDSWEELFAYIRQAYHGYAKDKRAVADQYAEVLMNASQDEVVGFLKAMNANLSKPVEFIASEVALLRVASGLESAGKFPELVVQCQELAGIFSREGLTKRQFPISMPGPPPNISMNDVFQSSRYYLGNSQALAHSGACTP